jgi:hypothetical protein
MTLKEGKKLLTVFPSVDCNTHPLTDCNEVEPTQLTHPSLRPVTESKFDAKIAHVRTENGNPKKLAWYLIVSFLKKTLFNYSHNTEV